MMTKRSVIKALRVMESDLVTRKRKVDEELQAVRIVIRLTEERDDDVKQSNTFAEVIGNAIYTVLKNERPLHRNEILNRVRKAGTHIGGNNPSNTIGSYLSRDERFTNVSKGMWTLEEDGPAANPEKNGQEEVDLAAIGLVS